MDEIYSRSPLMGVSHPTNFVHQVHVGFDPISGAFTGLPEQWTRLLTSSAITKEDYAKNPQAVLDVLEFYTDIQKRDAERDDYGLTRGREERNGNNVGRVNQPARFGAGTGLAGQRSDSLTSGNNNLPRLPNSNNSQSGFRQAPGPPPPPATSVSPRLPNQSTSARPADPDSSRLNLLPGRVAPGIPSKAPARTDRLAPSGLKPLLTSSLSRTNLSTPPSNVSTNTGSQPVPSNYRSLDVTSGNSNLSSTSPPNNDLATSSAVPTIATTASTAAEPLVKAPPPVKRADASGDRRISGMSEAQIMAKLRSVCSPQDPNTMYSKIKKVGQGASGSVYVAKVLATGSKVAIKQMDLSHQPRKELIVNEILVMKESQHPNIVNFLDSFLVKGAELWVVMEFMEGGALTDVIDSNSLEEDQISSISNEVLSSTCVNWTIY
jgi:hypothetical protein